MAAPMSETQNCEHPALGQEVAAHSASIVALERRIDKSDGMIRRLESKLDQVAPQLATIEASQRTAEAAMRKVGEKVDGLVETGIMLRQSAATIEKRLDTLNGSVAAHERRISAAETSAEITAAVEKATRAAAAKVDEKYQSWLKPIVKYALAALGVLLLEHGATVLKVLGKPNL